jgi:asparagine synthase (glutamine-hydrolysing)
MCGIVGFLTRNQFELLGHCLKKAGEALSHRGPDDGGLFLDAANGVGLGHRRLSIIDVSASGHQPMASDDSHVHIAYNGEVYNFREIRKILESHGHRFHGHSDTEVILKAYIQWGTQCLQKLEGMFALAIWDSQKRRLFLARDRMGIKPLYYHYKDNTLLFASELKALMTFHTFPRVINDEALSLYLHYQYIPGPHTIFQDTYKLLPGCFMVCEGQKPSPHPYWDLPDHGPDVCERVDEMACLNEFDQLLTQAVSDHLVSDVPIGALLSGGIDSSLVAALMKKVSSGVVRTFSIGFNEKKYDEAPWAARIAAHLGTEHTELYVDSDQALDIIAQLPEIYDEPFADSSAVPTYLVSKLTRSYVTVALSGDGGDEQFAGYVRYWMTRTMAAWLQHVPAKMRVLIATVLAKLPAKWIETIYLPWRDCLPQRLQVANFSDKWQKLVMQLGHEQLSELYRLTICLWSGNEITALIGQKLPPSRFEALFGQTAGWPVLSRLMRVDQGTYLPDCMLTKVDRASMAASLEVRVPLLDHRVVEYASRLPESLKYKYGTGKYLLKKVLTRYVPAELFERPKMGFGVPIDSWLRNKLKALLLDYLSPERMRREGRFNSKITEQKLSEHFNGTHNHHYRLWAILMWEMWREKWLS